MAQYDSADLLARTKRLAKRPPVDEDIDDPTWYVKLEEAQTYWMGQFAAMFPELNYGAPELMTTADAGETYTLASEPLGGHLEIRATRNGVLLIAGPDWSETADYTIESGGQVIRMPSKRKRTFGDGPYARYVKAPGLLSAAVQPVMKPAWARLLLPPRACYLFAIEGALRDPNYYRAQEQRLWAGDPDIAGDSGFLGTLKTQHFTAGMASVVSGDQPWYRNPDMR